MKDEELQEMNREIQALESKKEALKRAIEAEHKRRAEVRKREDLALRVAEVLGSTLPPRPEEYCRDSFRVSNMQEHIRILGSGFYAGFAQEDPPHSCRLQPQSSPSPDVESAIRDLKGRVQVAKEKECSFRDAQIHRLDALLERIAALDKPLVLEP